MLKQLRNRLTYANVMSSIAVFLILGGATAIAADQLAKNSVGKKQLKANAVTSAKIKKNAVTAAKIRDGAVGTTKIGDGAVSSAKIGDGAVSAAKIGAGAVTGAKVQDGTLTGADINLGTLGTVPSSATTDVVKTSQGKVALGAEATVLAYGPLAVVVRCEVPVEDPTVITPHVYIASSTDGTVFTSWRDGSSKLGPGTPLAERELNAYNWVDSDGEFEYDSASDIGVSATAANGQGFTAFVGLASEKASGTCWYWMNATILG
jgi:hypothetical protein